MSMKMRRGNYEFNVATTDFSFAAKFTPEVAVTAKDVKAKPCGCSQKALAALTALPLHADLKVAMAKGRHPYRLAYGGAQAQRLELRQSEKAVFVSLKTRFIYPLETARNLIFSIVSMYNNGGA